MQRGVELAARPARTGARSAPPSSEARLARFLADDRRRGFDAGAGAAPPPRARAPRRGRAPPGLDLHHLLLDGWSLPVVLGEVFAFYAAFARGREPELPAPPPVPRLRAPGSHARRPRAGRGLLPPASSPASRAPTPLGGDRPPAADGAAEARGGSRGESAASSARGRPWRRRRALSRPRPAPPAHRQHPRRRAPGPLLLAAPAATRRRRLRRHRLRPPARRSPASSRWSASSSTRCRCGSRRARGAARSLARGAPGAASSSCRRPSTRRSSRVQAWSEVPARPPLFESLVVFENYPIEERARRPEGGLTAAARCASASAPTTR